MKPHGVRLIGHCVFLFILSTSVVSRAATFQETAKPVETLESITAKLKSGEPLVFGTFGDSITYPCYHINFIEIYVTFVADALRKQYPGANIKCVHGGNMGTTGRGLDNTRFERYVLDHKPDIVFIMFGMNDCGGGEGGLQTFDDNLVSLINKTKERRALPVICNQNEIVYEHSGSRFGLPLYMERAMVVAEREGVPGVDCFALWQQLKEDQEKLLAYLNDYFHPNHAGQRLFAKAIVTELWPEAAKHVNTDVRTPTAITRDRLKPCLAPGPRGKQIVRTSDGTWYVLSARRTNDRIVELVVSVSRKNEPTWDDFEHITLIGIDDEAVFDFINRDLNGAMIFEEDSMVQIVLSWNIGTAALRLKHSTYQPDLTVPWTARLREPRSWLEGAPSPHLRPINLKYDQVGNGQVHDAIPDGKGGYHLLANDFLFAPHSGFEVLDGEPGLSLSHWHPSLKMDSATRKHFYKDGVIGAFISTDGDLRCVVQNDAKKNVTVHQGDRIIETHHMMLEEIWSAGMKDHIVAVGAPVDRHDAWREWFVDGEYAHATDVARIVKAQIPLLWSRGGEYGSLWVEAKGDGARENHVLVYESTLRPGAKNIGILHSTDGGFEFEVKPIVSE